MDFPDNMLSPEISDLESFIDSYHLEAQNENGKYNGLNQIMQGNGRSGDSSGGGPYPPPTSPTSAQQLGSSPDFITYTSSSNHQQMFSPNNTAMQQQFGKGPHFGQQQFQHPPPPLPSFSSPSLSGTELWGDKMRGGIDWLAHNERRGQYEHKRPQIQDRSFNYPQSPPPPLPFPSSSTAASVTGLQQQLNNQAMMQQLEQQKEQQQKEHEMRMFVAAMIQQSQQQQQQQIMSQVIKMRQELLQQHHHVSTSQQQQQQQKWQQQQNDLQLMSKLANLQEQQVTPDATRQSAAGVILSRNNSLQDNNNTNNNKLNIDDIDVEELRKQIKSGELVVVRKGDLVANEVEVEQPPEKTESPRPQQEPVQQQHQRQLSNSQQPDSSAVLQSQSPRSFSKYEPYKGGDNFFKANRNQRRSRSDDDPDWRNRDNKTPVARKPSYESGDYRKKKGSESDDWRKDMIENAEKNSDKAAQLSPSRKNSNSQEAVEKPKNQTTQNEKQQLEVKSPPSTPRQQQQAAPTNKTQHETKEVTNTGGKHQNQAVKVSNHFKKNIQSWIQSQKKEKSDLDEVIRSLTVSNSNENSADDGVHGNEIDDAQLSKFMEKIQLNATSEKVLQSYADDLCERAMKHPSFGYGASILCHRMSFMMVEHGLKFRNMIFSNMQKRYNTRDRLFEDSFTSNSSNISWFGFVHFLVHLYLNVTVPATNKRFKVLITPVFSCLMQILKCPKVELNHVKCFGEMFRIASASLECDDNEQMEKFMTSLRDSSLVAQDPRIREIYLRAIICYATNNSKNTPLTQSKNFDAGAC